MRKISPIVGVSNVVVQEDGSRAESSLVMATNPIGHELVDLGYRSFFAKGGQMQIDGCRLKARMPHVLLDLSEIDSIFEQMGGVAMA